MNAIVAHNHAHKCCSNCAILHAFMAATTIHFHTLLGCQKSSLFSCMWVVITSHIYTHVGCHVTHISTLLGCYNNLSLSLSLYFFTYMGWSKQPNLHK